MKGAELFMNIVKILMKICCIFRPSTLPAKTLEEEQRHRSEYKAILAAAKKKDAQTNAAKQKQQKQQLKLEEQQASSTKHFLQFVLPNWDVM